MVATNDQSLIPNAIVEFHTAKESGKSDAEAWQYTVARIRHDVLHLAVATCSLKLRDYAKGSESGHGYADCLHELVTLQKSFEDEPSG